MQALQTIATVAIAIFGAMIAYGQWLTSRQKLVMDLYDRRFQVFMDVRKIASEAIQLGTVTSPGFINEIVARAKFLFGEDINSSMVKLHSLVTELEMRQPHASLAISKHFDSMAPLFAGYLAMDQQVPRFSELLPVRFGRTKS